MHVFFFLSVLHSHRWGEKKKINKQCHRDEIQAENLCESSGTQKVHTHAHFSQVSSKPGGTADIWVHKGLDETLLFGSDTNTRAGCFRNTCATAANLAAMSRPLRASLSDLKAGQMTLLATLSNLRFFVFRYL